MLGEHVMDESFASSKGHIESNEGQAFRTEIILCFKPDFVKLSIPHALFSCVGQGHSPADNANAGDSG